MQGMSGEIEDLRQQLQEVVDRHQGDFLHPQVLKLSQELDRLIVVAQQGQFHEWKRHLQALGK
jgi:hypothetical protein